MVSELAVEPRLDRQVWIVEDEPEAAALASELCEGCGAVASVYHAPLPFLAALQASPPPATIVFDWRLENELSAALFMATRHRHPRLPVVYWTGIAAEALPGMIRGDRLARIVDKAGGTAAFEEALAWALGQGADR